MTTAVSDRAEARIAHLGLGAFARSHQAWFTELANRDGGAQWGIVAFTGRRPEAARRLSAQGCRYDLVVRGDDTDRVESVSAIVGAHDGADAEKWRQAISQVAIVTVTVTEAGYRVDPVERSRDLELLRSGALPMTPAGRLVDGFRARRDSRGGPLAVVSCDNLDRNGEILRDRVADLASVTDSSLAIWIDENVSFVSSVVDRITPAEQPPAAVTTDPCAVVTEPSATWILAGRFPAGRPAWELGGALFVEDLEPYERRKLWLLNAGHTLLACVGLMRGHETIAEAIKDASCRASLEELWDDAATVLTVPREEISAERERIVARFQNPRIRHALVQIAQDTDLKLAVRVLPVIRERRARGLQPGRGQLTAIAAWAALSESDQGSAAAQRVLGRLAPDLANDEAVAGELAAVARTLEPAGVRL